MTKWRDGKLDLGRLGEFTIGGLDYSVWRLCGPNGNCLCMSRHYDTEAMEHNKT